jgi:hypothetical protein
MRLTQEESSKDLFARFRAWFPDSTEDPRRFFTDGLVVVDANVLLGLYRIAPTARDQVLDALERVADDGRLWLPYQAGLEFVRNRRTAVIDRIDRFQRALGEVRRRFDTAVTGVVAARRLVQQLVWDSERDAVAREDLEKLIAEPAVREALKVWRGELVTRVKALQDAHDIDPDSLRESDPVLDRINVLLQGRIGQPLPYDEMPNLVQHFAEFRSPNQIPPGFEDSVDKGTHLLAAGDYLLWEEICRKAKQDPPPSRLVLLVTDDQKVDWRGADGQPRAELVDELWARSEVLLRMEPVEGFLEGAKEFLGVTVSKDTYAEVARAAVEDTEEPSPSEVTEPIQEEATAEGPVLPGTITEDNAELVDPGPLAVRAFRASGLVTPAARSAVAEDRLFAWWLFGTTAVQGLRHVEVEEPVVKLPFAVESAEPPAAGWEQERLRVSDGVRNVWLAPWLVRLLRTLPAPDRTYLRRSSDTVWSWTRLAVRPVTSRTRMSGSCPRSAASARQRSYKVSGASCCLGLRVAWTVHLTSRGVRSRPSASSRSSSASIWSVRLEKLRTSSSGIPWSSRLPWVSAGVHSTPSVRTSSRW